MAARQRAEDRDFNRRRSMILEKGFDLLTNQKNTALGGCLLRLNSAPMPVVPLVRRVSRRRNCASRGKSTTPLGDTQNAGGPHSNTALHRDVNDAVDNDADASVDDGAVIELADLSRHIKASKTQLQREKERMLRHLNDQRHQQLAQHNHSRRKFLLLRERSGLQPSILVERNIHTAAGSRNPNHTVISQSQGGENSTLRNYQKPLDRRPKSAKTRSVLAANSVLSNSNNNQSSLLLLRGELGKVMNVWERSYECSMKNAGRRETPGRQDALGTAVGVAARCSNHERTVRFRPAIVAVGETSANTQTHTQTLPSTHLTRPRWPRATTPADSSGRVGSNKTNKKHQPLSGGTETVLLSELEEQNAFSNWLYLRKLARRDDENQTLQLQRAVTPSKAKLCAATDLSGDEHSDSDYKQKKKTSSRKNTHKQLNRHSVGSDGETSEEADASGDDDKRTVASSSVLAESEVMPMDVIRRKYAQMQQHKSEQNLHEIKLNAAVEAEGAEEKSSAESRAITSQTSPSPLPPPVDQTEQKIGESADRVGEEPGSLSSPVVTTSLGAVNRYARQQNKFAQLTPFDMSGKEPILVHTRKLHKLADPHIHQQFSSLKNKQQ